MRLKLGFDPTSIHADFTSVLGDQAPSYSTVTRWVARFKEGREHFLDNKRVGRPRIAITQANINLVRVVIKVNPFSTYDDIQAETSLCHRQLNNIIHDCLKMRKITSRWMIHFLNGKIEMTVSESAANIWKNSAKTLGG